MNRPVQYYHQADAGVTLTELLVALAIGILILGVMFGGYFTVIQTMERQTAGRSAVAAAAALDSLSRDMLCTVNPGNDLTPFILQPATGSENNANQTGLKNWKFYTAVPLADRHSPQIYGIHEVTYEINRTDSGPANCELVRLTRPMKHDQEPDNQYVRETWGNFQSVDITLYDGNTWTNHWHGESQDLPHAARIIINFDRTTEQYFDMEIPIPAGIPFRTGSNYTLSNRSGSTSTATP